VRCVWRCFTTTTTNHHSMMRAQPRQWCPERAGHGLFARHRSQDLRPGRKRDLIVKIVYLLCPGANPALRLPPRPDGADGSVCVCVCVCVCVGSGCLSTARPWLRCCFKMDPPHVRA
jgi:hypothetical protein